MNDMQISTAPATTAPPTTTTELRARNLSDRRREAAITLVMEHLEVYGAVALAHPAKAASAAFRREIANRLLDSAAAQLRGK